jgi:DNA-binding transcriptional LysR family regulator
MPRPPSLSPELLQTFVTMVRTDGDAMAAAKQLGINQPSISKRLAILQHAGRILQTPWMERRGKRWYLTEEGKRVLPAVEEILHRYRILTEAIQESEGSRLSMSCLPHYSGSLLREAILKWRDDFPQERFRVVTPESDTGIEGVANGSYDLAIVTEGTDEIQRIAHRPLHVESLLNDPLVMVASPRCPNFQEFSELPEKKGSTKAITRFPLLLPERETAIRRELEIRFREESLRDRLQIVMELRDPEDLISYARDGIGVAMVPRLSLHKSDLIRLTMKPLPAPLAPPNEVKLICRIRPISEEMDLTPPAQGFRKRLLEIASGYEA